MVCLQTKNEPSIIPTMAHESLYLFSISRPCDLQNDLYLVLISVNSILGHYVPQYLSLSYHEETLVKIQVNLVQLTLRSLSIDKSHCLISFSA